MIINYPEVNIEKIFSGFGTVPRDVGNNGSKSRRRYVDCVCAFDIETTALPEIEQSFMYVWQFQVDELYTIIGRSWDQFTQMLSRIRAVIGDRWLVVYVHNLSYEFQFLSGIYEFGENDVFCMDSRKILKCDMYKHFEFRCSYIQSNMSLDEFTKKYNVQHQKISGDLFDYSKTRYPWTELNDIELKYITNDVLGLVEAIKKEMALDNDNLYSIPLTSTGYVRRDVKRSMNTYSRTALKKQLPDVHLFTLLHQAFRGGNTHANRYYAGLIQKDVTGYDISSSYPSQQVNREFPMGVWIQEDPKDLDYIIKLIEIRKHSCLMVCAFRGLKLRDELWGCPYIPLSKTRSPYEFVNDNGRIVSAEYLEITLTDRDFLIILQEYTFDDCEILEFYHTRSGKLPREITDLTLKWFTNKTRLKGVTGEEVFYMKEKNKLNSIYGMSVQNPAKQMIKYCSGEYVEENKSIAELLEASNRRAFQAYSWGVWVTAWARWQLEEGLRLIAPEDFIYSDTDSIKFINNYDKAFSGYNAQIKETSRKNGAAAKDANGKTHYLGVYEYDGFYNEFCTLGAKKYVYTDSSGLHCTIAGVNKKLGAIELSEAGGISAFKEGFTFTRAGGLESKYNDDPEIRSYRVGDKIIPITKNVYLQDSTYTLGITGEYKRLIDDLQFWKYYDNDLVF